MTAEKKKQRKQLEPQIHSKCNKYIEQLPKDSNLRLVGMYQYINKDIILMLDGLRKTNTVAMETVYKYGSATDTRNKKHSHKTFIINKESNCQTSR